jgi:HAD superfamily hydrolase (TIGR01490 family)
LNQRPFAVFDIDGTIFRSSLFLEMTYRAIDAGILPNVINDDIKDVKNAWLQRKDSEAYDKFILEAVHSFKRNIIGVNAEELQSIAKDTVEDYHEHTYTYTRDLLKKLKKLGYFIIAISGSPREVVTEFTKKYDFDFIRSTEYERENGVYTGFAQSREGTKKAGLEELISTQNLTLLGSIAVGDTFSDAPLLEMVENPIAFNPDKKLFKIAKEKGWKIVVERKNMIYELESQNGKYQLSDTETI